MAGLTTIALLNKRASLSDNLFSRYWRDVHGVMAARIEGFGSYTQYHVDRIDGEDIGPPLSGIAVVTFANEAEQEKLLASPLAPEIVRDEPNVFARALLYNLAEGDSTRWNAGAVQDPDRTLFAVFRVSDDARRWAEGVAAIGCEVHLHDLAGSDSSAWNGEEGSEMPWRFVVQCWPDGHDLPCVNDDAALYDTRLRCVMVENGAPTALGLRGEDALRTIEEAGATNQLDRHVEKLIYGL